MTRFRVESALVIVLGFSLGAVLSRFLVPGDVQLWIVLGFVFAILFHGFFVKDLGGELFWPVARHGNRLFFVPFQLPWRPSKTPTRLAGSPLFPIEGRKIHFRKNHRHND
jgi:hypothetical protein